ncbi:hypothetical protein [Tateyamaria pelophila]|uniref:hypothetical protein n=1 Tax=Tateyamaria pelophila TaxID=328415 RepID=UPI001CBF15B2|nr:hypothetical protein [Tateyamaria pelophila]
MALFIRKICISVGLLLAVLIGPAAFAGAVAVAVIPATVTGDGAHFTVETDSANGVKITFDIGAIPPGVQLESAVLRIVPTGPDASAQFIRIFRDGDLDSSIGALNVPTAAIPVTSTGTGLLAALSERPESLNVVLKSDSVRSTREYYSFADSNASNRPRLIVTWADTSPAMTRNGTQLRYRGSPDDATPWTFNAPDGALLSVLFPPAPTDMTVLTGPAFVGDTVVFMAKDKDATKLWGMSADGAVAWSYPNANAAALPDTSWKYLRLDDLGNLLAFRNDGHITVFKDFGPDGPTAIDTRAVPEINVSKRPVISAGGLVVFRKDQSSDTQPGNYIYALSPLPGLKTLWRSPANVGQSTAPVLSPRRGQQLVYVMGKDQSAGLSIFDNTTGIQPVPTGYPTGSGLGNFAQFHPPLTVLADPSAETPSDWVYLSAFGEDSGMVNGFFDLDKPGTPQRWNAPQEGPVSRCVSPLPGDGVDPVVYCVQAGQFRAYAHQSGDQICASDAKHGNIGATSNLIVDGAGSIFFWQEDAGESGVLRGFDPKCEMLFSQPLNGLPAKTDGIEVIDLRVGANGIIYAYSTAQVFAIRVTQPTQDPTVLAPDTQYFSKGDMSVAALTAPADSTVSLYADGTIDLGNLQVPATADVTCSARQAVSFDAGFSLALGATLRCGINKMTAKPTP